MSEFTVMVLRFAFFALLWIFIFLVAGVLRQDLFGSRRRGNRASRRRGRGGPNAVAAAGAGGAGAAGAMAAPPPMARQAPQASQPVQAQAPPQPRELHVVSGPLVGMVVALGTSPITIGRSSNNTVVLDDDFASGHHARIVPGRGQWFVEDLGSTNGTYINEQRLTQATPMRVGTPVTIGHTTMELRP